MDNQGGTRGQERTSWRPRSLDSLGGTKDAAGRQEMNNWTPGDTREAGKDQLDSLGSTREAPGRQERIK